MSGAVPDWVRRGKGITPRVRWSVSTEEELVDLAYARESGETVAADALGSLYRLDRTGQIVGATRGFQDVRRLVWSDTGAVGYVLTGDRDLQSLDRRFRTLWDVEAPAEVTEIACTPYGHHIAVATADGVTETLDSQMNSVGRFETSRPLAFLRFCLRKPFLIGAAEYGLLCQVTFEGTERWSEKLWSNVGDLNISADAQRIVAAGFNYGLQVFDGTGRNRATYVVEGTVHRASISVAGDRFAAGTLERHLYWLDSDGALLWATNVPGDIANVVCDPLGEWLILALRGGEIVCLDWSSS